MFPTSDPLDSHISAVRSLGVEPPLDWTELLEYFERYTSLDERPSTARLVRAVVDPENGDDIVALRADALRRNIGDAHRARRGHRGNQGSRADQLARVLPAARRGELRQRRRLLRRPGPEVHRRSRSR